MYALYAFARITDDLGDNPSPAADRLRLLNAWQEQLESLTDGDADGHADGNTTNNNAIANASALANVETRTAQACSDLRGFEPLWQPLAATLRQYSIPLELLTAVVEGVRRDVYPRPPADWNELEDYCYHVASAVGLACVHIWKIPNTEQELPRQAAIDCGVAFQLTNILRDVADDARQGRLYLPLSELERHGVSPTACLAGHPDGDWCNLIASVAERAEQYYQQGWPTIHYLTPRSRRMFSLMWCSYRALLQRVVARRQLLWRGPRVRLTRVQQAYLLTRHMILPQRGRTDRATPSGATRNA